MGEISRVGGGQFYMEALAKALSGNELTLISDRIKDPLGIQKLFNNYIDVNYFYTEHESIMKVLWKVLKLKKVLNRMAYNGDFLINNHPNIYIKPGNLNILHGMSFIERFIDERGNIANKMMVSFINKSGLYKIYNHSNVVVNSDYTADIVKKAIKYLGIDVKIVGKLNPACALSNVSANGSNILLFGRINRDKKIERFMNIAGLINNTIIVAGAVDHGDDEKYLKFLKSIAPPNVKFKENPDNKEKQNLFMGSKIYIHTNPKENFGITVVEAMSYGIIPVVPKTGGPWTDVVNYGKYGFGYSEPSEIPDIIEKALKSDNDFIGSIRYSARRFSQEAFKDNLNYIISKYIQS